MMILQGIIHLLNKRGSLFSVGWHMLNNILGQVVTVKFVEYPHVKWCGNVTFFTIAVNQHIAIRASEEDVANQPFKAMISEEDRFVGGEVAVEFSITQTARIDFRTAQLQQVNHVNEANLQIWGKASCSKLMAARLSMFGSVPAAAMTTSGSTPSSLEAQSIRFKPELAKTVASSML